METGAMSSTIPYELYQGLLSEYKKLKTRYRELKQKREDDKIYVKFADEKYKAAKESARQWRAYYDRNIAARQKRDLVAGGAGHIDRSVVGKPKSDGCSGLLTSSQTTQGEPEAEDEEYQHIRSDDEPPVVVFARQVRKPKGATHAGVLPRPVKVKQEPNSSAEAIELVSGDNSSPASKRPRPVPTETSDLDTHVQHFRTPRKRKRQRVRAVSEETIKAPALPINTSSLSESNLPGSAHLSPFGRADAITPDTGNNPVVQTRGFALSTSDQALRPISVNVARAPRTTRSLSGGRSSTKSCNSMPDIALISEDGEFQKDQVAATTPYAAPGSDVNRRLNALLAEPCQDRIPLSKRVSPNTSFVHEADTSERPIKQEISSARNDAQHPMSVLKHPRGPSPLPPRVQQLQKPLRQRPLAELTLSDFKINPAYLSTSFAFADTLRTRDQRRCLTTCTRPDCCGSAFLAASKMNALPTTNQTQTDSQLLETYLGPHYLTILGAYGPEKRRDLLMQARAHAFANAHGKHRHAFERRSTPPGFWRTDMPTTQEEEADRVRAAEMERRKVEERWREAMRGVGGRWVFRDE